MLGRAVLFAVGIVLWGVGRGFGVPARWAGALSRPDAAAGLLFVAACLLALAIVAGTPRRAVARLRNPYGFVSFIPGWQPASPGWRGLYWLLAGLLWAAVSGATGSGDAWRYLDADDAIWTVRWTDVSPPGSTRPWEGVVLGRADRAVWGRVQFWPPSDCAGERWLPGDTAALTARLTWPEGPHNPGQADTRVGLATAGLAGRLQVRHTVWCGAEPVARGRWRPAAWAEQGRRALRGVMERHLGHAWTGFAAGLLLGRGDEVPTEWREAFRESGALHLMAVSGTHLSLVVAPLWPLLRRHRSLWWLPLAAGLGYVWLSGTSPSALRAGMQLLLTLGLRRPLHGERQTALLSPRERLQPWALAALLTLVWDPLALFRPALQLSLAASAGICLWADRWQTVVAGRFGSGTIASYIADGLAPGMAAQTAVWPLCLWLFGGIAPVGFVSSLVLLPVTGLALHMLLAGLPVALLLPGLGAVALAPAALLLRALAGLAMGTAKLPPGFVWWPAGAAGAFVMFVMFGAAGGLWPWPGRRAAAVAVIAGIAGQLWLPALLPDVYPAASIMRPAVSVTFLDVGQGDAIVIQAPDGSVTLIDGGGSLEWGDHGGRGGSASGAGGPDPGRTVVVPYLRWARIGRLERIIVTHAHADHVGGLATVLAAVPVGEVIEPGEPEALGGEAVGPAYARFRRALDAEGVARRTVRYGDTLDLGGGLTAAVLGPPEQPHNGTRSDLNSNSIVLRLQYGRWRALLTGDMEAAAEDWLLGSGLDLRVHVLKVAHHGSNYSTQPRWLAATGPEVAVISAGRRNPFGHPGAATLARLAAAGACTLRTDAGGAVSVTTDGRRWKATTFHGGRACADKPSRLR